VDVDFIPRRDDGDVEVMVANPPNGHVRKPGAPNGDWLLYLFRYFDADKDSLHIIIVAQLEAVLYLNQ